MKQATPVYIVTSKSAGNPDHGQFGDEGILFTTLELECASAGRSR